MKSYGKHLVTAEYRYENESELMNKYLIVILLLIIQPIGYTQPQKQLLFSEYDYEDGLLINPIDVMLQDRQGYMWFGSKYGLSRYDGYAFQTFTHDPEDPGSLSHTHVTSLVEDDEGNLWIGTFQGLNKLSPARDRFQRIYFSEEIDDSHNQIHCLHLDEKDRLWVGCKGALIWFDPASGMQQVFSPKPSIPSEHLDFLGSIISVCADEIGNVWFSSMNRLFKMDIETEETVLYYQEPPKRGFLEQPSTELQSSFINTILNLNDGKLWIATWAGGLSTVQPETGEFFTYPFHYQSTKYIYKTITDILIDRDGLYWLATENGLCRFDSEQNIVVYDLPHQLHQNGISSSLIHALYQERSGAVWIATDVNLHRYEPSENSFQALIHNPIDPNSLGASAVYSMCEGDDGVLWFGTHYGGLNAYDPHTKKIKRFMHDPSIPVSIPDNTVTALCTDPSGKIWVGTWTAGLCLFDPAVEEFHHFPFTRNKSGDPKGEAVVGTTIRSIEIARNGEVWIGSADYTISIYNPETKRFRYLVDDLPNPFTPDFKSIYKLYKDRHGTMWIGTGNYGVDSPGMGLYQYNPNDDAFRFFNIRKGENGIWGSEIPDMVEDQKGNLWFATEHGVTHLDTSHQHFTDFFPTDGFWGNDTAAILESDDGMIWVSSRNYGLSVMDPNTGTVQNYGKNEGLHDVEFLSASALKASDGTLYFGGMGGVTIIPKGVIETNSFVPPVAIQQCTVLDDSIPQSTLQSGSSMQLRYWQNTIQFEYVSLNYSSPEKNRYQYRLVGLNDQWVDAGTGRSALFSYLPAGEYTFEVMGSNNDGVWNETPASFSFHIAPPFWQTLWFRFGMVVLLVTVIFIIFYLRVRSIRERNRYLEEQVQARTISLERERDHSGNILKKSPLIIFGFTAEGTVTFINPAGEQYLQVQDTAVSHRYWWELFPNALDRQTLHEIHQQLSEIDIVDQETNLTLFNDDKRTVIWSFIRHMDETSSHLEYIAFGNDVTEKMEREILEASTRAQRNIGREIHDSICQSLTGIYCLSETLSRNQEDPVSANAQLVDRMKKHIQDVTVQSRNIARSLYLHELEHLGLKQALQEFANKVENLFQVKCNFTCDADLPGFDFDTSTHLYRIAQEAVNNSVKYSGADEVNLTINSGEKRIDIEIEDRGQGFDLQSIGHKGMGMNIMKYRARMIKADLSIQSQPNQGTVVRCSIP